MIIYLFLSLFAEAHVRMYFSDTTYDLGDRPIRNANTQTADGQFSVSGPCGGASTWGGNGGTQISSVDVGGTVTLKINYNGGHKSDANEFAVRFACGSEGNGPSEEDMRNADVLTSNDCEVLQCPTTGEYPCNAAIGNDFTQGYMMRCTVPQTAAGQDCTFSMLDQREWGGCVDVAVGRTVNGVTVYPLADHAGTYSYKNKNVFTGTPKYPNCCCTMEQDAASFDVTVDTNANTAALSGNVRMNCPDHDTMTAHNMQSPSDTVISTTLTATDTYTWKGSQQMGGQAFEFSLNGRILYYSNTDSLAPMICDGYIVLDSVDDTVGTGQVTDDCPAGFINDDGDFTSTVISSGGDSGGVGAFPFIIVIAVILLCVGGYTAAQGEKAPAKQAPPTGLTKEQVLAQV